MRIVAIRSDEMSRSIGTRLALVKCGSLAFWATKISHPLVADAITLSGFGSWKIRFKSDETYMGIAVKI